MDIVRIVLFLVLAVVCFGQNTPTPSAYRWETDAVGNSAQLSTLFYRTDKDIPLVSVLRDTLGDDDPSNDRLMYVWLLTYSRQSIPQRLLAAIPFFYWHVSNGKGGLSPNAKPLLNLTAPTPPVVANVSRTLLQWTLLDPMTTPIRASSRAYRTNQQDHERLHLEEAIGYLRRSPTGTEGGLTSEELHTVTARLELRKRMLGGLVNARRAAQIGEEDSYEEERTRTRNWELLRQCAEKAGLLFEPLDLGAGKAEYGVLYYQPSAQKPQNGADIAPIWKLLNIRDPWTDNRLADWKEISEVRSFDADGRLLPYGSSGVRQDKVIPLGIYSLLYPKLPLLLIDFRDTRHIRNHELAQRTINEITAGIIGVSHFTNWYYFAGADLYNFVAARRGRAVDRASRLECYSRFRVAITLDQTLPEAVRADIQQRVNSLALNPLESSPEQEIRFAELRYQQLAADAANGVLLARVNQDRRAEVADFHRSQGGLVWDGFLHLASLGTYTRRAPESVGIFAVLNHNRKGVGSGSVVVGAGAP